MIHLSKITLLGGSGINTPEFFEALRQEDVCPDEVCLIGRSHDKLKAVADFSNRLCDELDLPTRVTTATDLNGGLDGAQFVINQVKVGGSNVWMRCQHTMRAFGISGQALLHPGGVSNLNIVLDFARAVVDVCPTAWFIEFTNPCVIHAEAFAHYTPELNVISGCNVPLNARREIAEFIERPLTHPHPPATHVGEVEIAWFGFNHCGWVQDVTVDGISVMKEVIRRNAELDSPQWDVNQIEQFGLIPVAEAASLFTHLEAPAHGTEEDQARGFSADDDARDTSALDLYADRSRKPTEALSQKGRVNWYHTAIAPIVAGLGGRQPRRYFSAWLAREAMPDFPDRVVECGLTLCDGKATPFPSLQPMPRSIHAMCELLRASEQLTIKAAVTRSRKTFIDALAIHPSCPSLLQAERVVDFLIAEAGLDLMDVSGEGVTSSH